jgi:hypothetical protein
MDTYSIVSWWENLRVIWAGLGLSLAILMVLVVWRVRGLLLWKRSQRQELAQLRQLRETAQEDRVEALDEIITSCEAIMRSTSLELGHFNALPGYWRRIAACYFPEESQPELCLSIGRLLATAQQLADRAQALVQRPGFDRLGRLRIRQLRRTCQWYQTVTGQPVVAWIIARRKTISVLSHSLRFMLPDPLVWIAYLSQRLTVLMAARCLLVDVYLYTGKSALDAFDSQSKSIPLGNQGSTSDSVLEAFETTLEKENSPMPAELTAIRNALVGLPGRLWKPPGVREWCHAVEDAARAIAVNHFPTSAAPLDEATCRVLLDKGRCWLEAMAAARRMPVVRPLYRISLKRVVQIKAISESDLLQLAGKVAGGAWHVWRWARWPIKAMRWVRRRSPAGVAIEVSMTLALKSMQNFLARYGFDRACQELDVVYRLSGNPKPPRISDKNRLPSDSIDSE